MKNIKLAASIIAGVAVAGATAQKIIHHVKTEKLVKELHEAIDNIESVLSPEASAFNRAQAEISDRMLSGYYDDKSDDQVRHDFHVLYVNYQKNN